MTMKRVTQVLYRWRNLSGLFEGPTGYVKAGEEFVATQAQVPQAFRDTIECLGPAASEPPVPAFAKGGLVEPPAAGVTIGRAETSVEPVEPVTVEAEVIDDVEIDEADELEADVEIDDEIIDDVTATPGTYEVVSRGAGWYDVVDAAGEAVNPSALRLGPANALAEELNNG